MSNRPLAKLPLPSARGRVQPCVVRARPAAMHPDRLPALLQRLDRHGARLDQNSLRLSRFRLATALIGIGLALTLGQFVGAGAGWITALAAVLIFAALVRVHERVARAQKKLRFWGTIQARHLARRALDWDALGPPPLAASTTHAFAADLDVAGPRSLLHLLDTPGTSGGRARLRGWLLAESPDPEAAQRRQRRVRALVPRRRLRDRISLHAHLARGSTEARWDDRHIHAWLEAPPPDPSVTRWAVVLSTLAVLTPILVALALMGGPSLWAFSLSAYIVLYLNIHGRFKHVFNRAYDLQRGLSHAAPVLLFAERDGARRDPVLKDVWAPLAGGDAPSAHLKRLDRIASAAAATQNDVLRGLLNILLPYDLLFSIVLSRLRTKLARRLPPWLDAIYEIEALGALAAAHALRPDATVFPTLVASDARTTAPEASGADDGRPAGAPLRGGAAPLMNARDLRHPLLPLPDARGNDVTLGPGEVVVVTGSNMSGKSTFLRAVGLASVLAWAGGPVWAATLAVRPLRPFASMRIGDVLQEGLSTFYAEVKRLKALLDSVEAPPDRGPGQTPEASGDSESGEATPSLVLIDEMLRGTNNRERLAGAQAIVRALAGAHATSLVATHDLALADLEAENPLVSNAHFRERADGDRLAFDYLLREGPCPTTNALVIMQRAGLPVSPDDAAPM